MTESEAIKWLKETRAYQHKCDNCAYIDIGGACNDECKDCHELAIKALEKQIAKKPCLDQKGLLGVKMWHCPICKKEVISDWNRDLANDYCHHCGQKLDWE